MNYTPEKNQTVATRKFHSLLLLSAGQGVVMHRSIYSDFVFLETLVDCGFMTNKGEATDTHSGSCFHVLCP